ILSVILHQKEPVSAPGDIAENRPMTRNRYSNVVGKAEAGNIGDCNLTCVVRAYLDDADRGFNAMIVRLDPSQVFKSGHQANHSMPGQAQVAEIVEENHARMAAWIGRRAEQSTDRDIRAAWLVDDGRTEGVELLPKSIAPLGQGATAQVGTAGD